MLQYLGPGGYHPPNQNSATGLNNIINQLRQRRNQQPQQPQQAAPNPGNNRPRPPVNHAFLNPSPPTTVQNYTPRPGPIAKPIVSPITSPIGTPQNPTIPQAPATLPIPGQPQGGGAPIGPIGIPRTPPVVPATGPYGPVAGIPLQRMY